MFDNALPKTRRSFRFGDISVAVRLVDDDPGAVQVGGSAAEKEGLSFFGLTVKQPAIPAVVCTAVTVRVLEQLYCRREQRVPY